MKRRNIQFAMLALILVVVGPISPAGAQADGATTAAPEKSMGPLIGRYIDASKRELHAIYENDYAEIITHDLKVYRDETPVGQHGRVIAQHVNNQTSVITRVYRDGTISDQFPNGAERIRSENVWKLNQKLDR